MENRQDLAPDSEQPVAVEDDERPDEPRLADLPGHRTRENLRYIPIDFIVPNPHQPRASWEAGALESLTRSILEKGLLEPIILRPIGGDRYELVAGERRWRACKAAGYNEIPALVRSMEDHESLEAALIENLQRSDLNPVEEARAYRALAGEFGLKHDEIAKRVSKDRSTITNLLRILALPAPILEHIAGGGLSVGHARVLLTLPEEYRVPIAERMVQETWSVRKAEAWAKSVSTGDGLRRRKSSRGKPKPENILRLEEQLCRHFGTEVRIRIGRKGGKLELGYYDDEDLSRLLDLLGITVH